MNSSVVKKSEDRVILMDELFVYTTLSLFLMNMIIAMKIKMMCKNMHNILEM